MSKYIRLVCRLDGDKKSVLLFRFDGFSKMIINGRVVKKGVHIFGTEVSFV